MRVTAKAAGKSPKLRRVDSISTVLANMISRAAYHREWYHKTKEKRRELTRKNRLDSKKRLTQIVVDYLKTHPCVDCRESDILVLDFDHTRDKVSTISNIIRNCCSKTTLLIEIEKCEIRCANCHRRKTAERGGWYLKKALS